MFGYHIRAILYPHLCQKCQSGCPVWLHCILVVLYPHLCVNLDASLFFIAHLDVFLLLAVLCPRLFEKYPSEGFFSIFDIWL